MAQFHERERGHVYRRCAMADGSRLTGSSVVTGDDRPPASAARTVTVQAAPTATTVITSARSRPRDLRRLGRQGHRPEPRRQGRDACIDRERHLRHLRRSVSRSSRTTPPSAPDTAASATTAQCVVAAPRRRDGAHVQRHQRQHHGRPVRAPPPASLTDPHHSSVPGCLRRGRWSGRHPQDPLTTNVSRPGIPLVVRAFLALDLDTPASAAPFRGQVEQTHQLPHGGRRPPRGWSRGGQAVG